MTKSNGANGLKPTPAHVWQQAFAQTKTITLRKAGFNVTVRAITPDLFLRLGRIPTPLQDAMTEFAMGGGLTLSRDNLEAGKALLDMLDSLCEVCIVSPKVLSIQQEPNPEKEEISVAWIPVEDKYDLLELLTLPVGKLESFRPGQGANVESVDAPEVNGDTGQPEPEPEGVG